MNKQKYFNYTEEEIEAEAMAQEIHSEELAKYEEYRLEVDQAMQEAHYERQEEYRMCQELDRISRLKNLY